jgi:hypothetical protein
MLALFFCGHTPNKTHFMPKYSKKAGDKVERAMHEKKAGTLKSGRSGKKVTSRKQAIAIGLSEAREEGAKAPKKAAKKTTGKASTRKTSTRKTSTRKTSSRKTSTRKTSSRKTAAKKSAPKKAAKKSSARKTGAKKAAKKRS